MATDFFRKTYERMAIAETTRRCRGSELHFCDAER